MSKNAADDLQHGHTMAVMELAGTMQRQTEAFTDAMAAQTAQIAKLSEKVDMMNARVIRLEEQRHGKDIQKLADEVAELNERVKSLELLRAKGEGVSSFMNWMRQFAPWFLAIGIVILVAMGFERTPKS